MGHPSPPGSTSSFPASCRSCRRSPRLYPRHPERSEWTTVFAFAVAFAFDAGRGGNGHQTPERISTQAGFSPGPSLPAAQAPFNTLINPQALLSSTHQLCHLDRSAAKWRDPCIGRCCYFCVCRRLAPTARPYPSPEQRPGSGPPQIQRAEGPA